jgi:fatty-acyl-CoA synthase
MFIAQLDHPRFGSIQLETLRTGIMAGAPRPIDVMRQVIGRIKDMIIRGGENIYPREIEEFLHTHDKVSDVQVIGVPDHKYGEEVCAWIRLRDGVTATAEEFREFCRGQIATYKIPRYVRFTSEFPMTVTGKVQKFKMRELTVAERTLARVTDVEPT